MKRLNRRDLRVQLISLYFMSCRRHFSLVPLVRYVEVLGCTALSLLLLQYRIEYAFAFSGPSPLPPVHLVLYYSTSPASRQTAFRGCEYGRVIACALSSWTQPACTPQRYCIILYTSYTHTHLAHPYTRAHTRFQVNAASSARLHRKRIRLRACIFVVENNAISNFSSFSSFLIPTRACVRAYACACARV